MFLSFRTFKILPYEYELYIQKIKTKHKAPTFPVHLVWKILPLVHRPPQFGKHSHALPQVSQHTMALPGQSEGECLLQDNVCFSEGETRL